MNLQTPKLKVLVIEDNPGDALLLEEYLRMTELKFQSIILANRLKEGLRIAQEQNPDVIFLDLSLPDSKGIESFTQINKICSNVPVIILSGINNNEFTLEAISAGAQDYLVKGDFSTSLLQKSILYSIERKKTQESVRLSNERFNAVSSASQDSIWDWNLLTNDFYSNEAMSQTLGYSKEQISAGHDWWYRNVHNDDRERANLSFQKAIVSGFDKWQHEYRFHCADRSLKYIYGRGIILRDGAGKPYRIMGIMQDITEVYTLQQSLANELINKQKLLAQATIEAQEKERGHLGKELHDNINQLLAATKLYLNVASTRQECREEMITKSIGSICHVMEEIRKLSKALVPPTIGLINLSDALQDLTGTMGMGGTLKIGCYVNVDNKALTYKQQLNVYRIVQEQVNNILKHAHANNAQITVEQEDDQIKLIIADDGVGFNTKTKVEGIGLKNIQGRAEIINGRMSLSSQPGKGCTVKITFPLEVATASSETIVSPLTVQTQPPVSLHTNELTHEV